MVNRKTGRNKRINRRKSVSRNKFMGGANTRRRGRTPSSQPQFELLQCRDMLAQRNQEIAELQRIPAISAEPLVVAALADLPVAQLLSSRRDDSTRRAIEADITDQHRRMRRARAEQESVDNRGADRWEQRSLPNGRQFWWNGFTGVATWNRPRNTRSRSSSIVPVDGSGSETRNMKKKNKKKSKKKKGKGRR